jgi:hypothetical protein
LLSPDHVASPQESMSLANIESFGFNSSSDTPSARLAKDAPKNDITVLKGEATRLNALAGRDSSEMRSRW